MNNCIDYWLLQYYSSNLDKDKFFYVIFFKKNECQDTNKLP